MLKTQLSKMLCLTMALQFVVPAQVFATTPAEQRQQIVDKTAELLNLPSYRSMEFKDANKRPLSREQFLAQFPTEFYALPADQLNGAPYALRVKSQQRENGEFVVAVAIMDQALQTTLTRRAVTMNGSDSAAQRMVTVERAVNSMLQSLQTASTKEKAKARSVASAKNTDRLSSHTIETCVYLGVVTFFVGFLFVGIGLNGGSYRYMQAGSVPMAAGVLIMITAAILESNNE